MTITVNAAHSNAQFKKAVRAARYDLKLLKFPDQNKIFAFPKSYDLSEAVIRRRTQTRKKYVHLRKQIAATLRDKGFLSPNLASVAADMVEGRRPLFKKQKPFGLNQVIGMAVARAAQYVSKYGTEDMIEGQTAFDAVALAANQLRLKAPGGGSFTYDIVRDRYEKYSKVTKTP